MARRRCDMSEMLAARCRCHMSDILAFWSLQSAITDLPGDVFKKLFDSLVAPVLDYVTLFWSHHISGTLLERVQQKAYRCFLGTGRKHPLAAAAGDMCWIPTVCRHRIQCILDYNNEKGGNQNE